VPGELDLLRRTLDERIAAADRSGAVSTALDAVSSGDTSIPALYDVLTDLLVDVGAAWQSGDTEVWQEHLATAVVRTIVEACAPLVAEQAAAPTGRTAVLATPPDEFHDVGLRMLTDRFVLAGWTAHLLGASVPVTELLAAVDTLGADAVVLSVSTHFHRLSLRRYVDAVRAARPALQVWVGGAAFAHGHEGWPDSLLLDPAAFRARTDDTDTAC
jgi:methanogenic corrinoid protein MtbC1